MHTVKALAFRAAIAETIYGPASGEAQEAKARAIRAKVSAITE